MECYRKGISPSPGALGTSKGLIQPGRGIRKRREEMGLGLARRDDFQICRVLELLVPQPSLNRLKRGTLALYLGGEIQKYMDHLAITA